MRSAFIEPEKFLIEKINAACSHLNQIKFHPTTTGQAKVEMQAALTRARDAVAAVKSTYQNIQTPEQTAAFYALWQNIETLHATFSRDTDALGTIVHQYAQRIRQMGTRAETIDEFIADIAAERDGGVSQQSAVVEICIRLSHRERQGLFQDRHLLTQAQVNRITGGADTALAAMQRNQEAAVTAFTETLGPLHEMTKDISTTESNCITAWEEFNELTKQCQQKKASSRLTKLVNIISTLLETLSAIQTRIKYPKNNFGLAALIHEIQFGQEALFNQFKATQEKFREIAELSNRLANTSPPASPTASSPACSSPRFSFSSASDTLGSAADDRKRARSGSFSSESSDSDDTDDTDDSYDSDIALLTSAKTRHQGPAMPK